MTSVGATGSTGTRVVTGADGELAVVTGGDGIVGSGDSTAAAGAAADGGSSGSARFAGSSLRAAARLIAAMNVPTAPLVMSSPTPIMAVRRPGTCSYAPVSTSVPAVGRPGRAADVGACRPGRREAWWPRRLTLDDLTACLSVWGDRGVVFRARVRARSPFHGRLWG